MNDCLLKRKAERVPRVSTRRAVWLIIENILETEDTFAPGYEVNCSSAKRGQVRAWLYPVSMRA
ncbi:Src y 3 domain [Echinococcus multilocularis]|uniref:Src y 3 domain n=1 Tax=Echinococcus multilocularis TaxID=6211 RepID=A0A068XXM6_ECHMU|nr:Src y 3 domain [Echinococcus multilocularis]